MYKRLQIALSLLAAIVLGLSSLPVSAGVTTNSQAAPLLQSEEAPATEGDEEKKKKEGEEEPDC